MTLSNLKILIITVIQDIAKSTDHKGSFGIPETPIQIFLKRGDIS